MDQEDGRVDLGGDEGEIRGDDLADQAVDAEAADFTLRYGRGYGLLKKMGWKEGSLKPGGIEEPIDGAKEAHWSKRGLGCWREWYGDYNAFKPCADFYVPSQSKREELAEAAKSRRYKVKNLKHPLAVGYISKTSKTVWIVCVQCEQWAAWPKAKIFLARS